MCLAVPAKIIELKENQMASVEITGIVRDVSIMLLDDVQPGEYVLVHAGFALEKVDEKTAQQTIKDLESIQ